MPTRGPPPGGVRSDDQPVVALDADQQLRQVLEERPDDLCVTGQAGPGLSGRVVRHGFPRVEALT
ncbi:hypothetical protein ACFQZC_09125 [Streptacidiphilus monticola]